MLRRLVPLVALTAVLGLVPAGTAQGAARTVVLHSRPFVVGGFATGTPKVRVETPRVDGHLTQMDAVLVDMRGRVVPIQRVMLHHLVFIAYGPGSGVTSCAGRPGEPFWGTGEEHQKLRLPPGYGYKLKREQRWLMQTMLMNHGAERRRVRVRYVMRVVTGERLQAVKPLWLRANGCTRHPSYDVPGWGEKGTFHFKTSTWRMPISGRIVAAGAHLHAGSRAVTLKQRECGNRSLINNVPRYAGPTDEVYRVRPVLHEPGPVSVGYWLSAEGIPVRRGEVLEVTGTYDADRARPGVMAVSHVYVARGPAPKRRCAELPARQRIHWERPVGTDVAPDVRVPLTRVDDLGRFVEVDRPPGIERLLGTDATVPLRGSRFVPQNLSIPVGRTVTWRWDDPVRHNVVLAFGPRSVQSPTSGKGTVYRKRFNAPGTYKLLCTLHPVTMQQVLRVRGPGEG